MTEFIKISEIDTLELDRLGDDNPSDYPFYVLVAGGMGAGKTHIINKHIESIEIFDIDLVMEELGFLEYTDDQFAQAMQEIALKIDDQFRLRQSMVAMGTSSNTTLAIDRLHAAKMNGYRTILIHIDAPTLQAILQNRRRLDNGERGVRLSDEHKIERTSAGAARTAAILRESALVDYFVYYNNYRDIDEI